MKKTLLTLGAFILAASIFAGGIDNKTNINSGYLRNPSRNTESKRPEAVLYNIAGTGFMEDGLSFNVGNQFIFKEYTNELNGTEYKDDKSVFFFPDFEAVYKQDNWSAFFGFGIFAGGGTTDYKDGNAGITDTFSNYAQAYSSLKAAAATACFNGAAANHSLEAYSVTMGEVLGGSYVFNDMVSVSVAGRFLHGEQNMSLKSSSIAPLNGGDEVSFDASGVGFGGIFGVNVKNLVDRLYLSVQYQTITKLDFEFDSTKGTLASGFGIEKGESFHNDLPAVLNLGVGYDVLDNLYVSASFNYYFNKQADMQSALNSADLDYDDSWEIGLGADYQLNDKIGLSCGLMYSNQGAKDDVNSTFNPVLDSVVAGCGVEYKVMKELMLTASYMHCRYIGQEYKDAIDLDKNIYLAALGVTFKPF